MRGGGTVDGAGAAGRATSRPTRRDPATLAALFRAGELTAIWVSDAAQEAMRDLSRGRQAAMGGLRRARQQLLSFLLRHGRIYPS